MKKQTYIQVELSSSKDIENMMVFLKGYNGPHGKVTLAYGIAEYQFERGIRYINVYEYNEIKYTTTRNKQVKLFNVSDFMKHSLKFE
jgi:hypothetical protein